MSKYENADYQEKVGKLVERGVISNVSQLVNDLTGSDLGEDWFDMHRATPDADDYNDNIPDSITVQIHGSNDTGWSYVINSPGRQTKASDFNTEFLAWQAVYDHESLDYPDGREVFEHWIVSEWFADKLEAAGEVIEKDFHGLTIWGRTCSGQAILLDSVICDIYDALQS